MKRTKKRIGISMTALQRRFLRWVAQINNRATVRYQAFLSRRPHRSFRRTYRRDYTRSLKLPGYIAFTIYVWRTLYRHRRTFGLLILFYAALLIAIGAVTSQDIYNQVGTLLKESSSDLFGAGIGKVGQAGLLAASTFLTGPSDLSVDQQIYVGISLLFAWLSTVWLLREYLLGRKPRLRDGLYNSGSPVLATLVVIGVLMVQLLPIGFMALAYAGLASVGILNEGFGSMLFWLLATVIAALVLYWITSTLIALVVVTLPGMYPMRAISASSDLVVGRRLRILYRWLWAALVIVLGWAIVVIPVILLDTAMKSAWPAVKDVPVVPYTGALMTSVTTIWFAAYVYLLYRKVVDDDAKPA